MLRIVGILIFVFVASVAPYVSALGAPLAFAQNPEERDIYSSRIMEEKIDHEHEKHIITVVFNSFVDYTFPQYISLKEQNVPEDFLKPPSLKVI